MHWFLKFIFCNKTLYVSDSSSVHHQEFFTLHTEMVYVIQFYSKNKFQKLVHLVGFIIRIYQDAWSPEGQIMTNCVWKTIILTFIRLSGFIVWNLYWGTGKNNFKIDIEFCERIFLRKLNEDLRYKT